MPKNARSQSSPSGSVASPFLARTGIFLLWFIPVTLCPLRAQGQGTAFTYNGRLADGGQAPNGNYDMTFQLFDSETGGATVGAVVQLNTVMVANGLFAVTVDFGAGVFTGPARWLEVGVRPSGTATFTTLSPRQGVTSSPYAVFASEAAAVAANGIGALAIQDGSISAGKISSGQVVKSLNGLTDAVTLQAGANVSLMSNGNALVVSAASGTAGFWGQNGTSAYYTAGNVGIGTTTPRLPLSLGTAPTWTANGWLGCMDLPNASALAWEANGAGQRFGIGHTAGGLYLFRTASDPGTTGSPALYDLVVDDSGNVSMSGDVTLEGNLIVDRTLGNDPLLFTGTDRVEENRYLELINSPDFQSASGLKAGGVLVADDYTYGNPGKNDLIVKGSTTIGGPLSVGDNFTATIGCADLLIGYSGRRGSPGRALSDLGTTLNINCCGDWTSTYIGGGNVSVCSLTIRGGCDLAEPFPTEGGPVEKGAVMVIDDEHPGQLKRSNRAYDTRVAGVVSGAKGINPGIRLEQKGAMDAGQSVALTGRVYVQADASFGAIKPGDLLTTSDTPGHAMKVMDHSRARGAVLGKAMSSLAEGKGMVLVLVTLQ